MALNLYFTSVIVKTCIKMSNIFNCFSITEHWVIKWRNDSLNNLIQDQGKVVYCLNYLVNMLENILTFQRNE